VSSWISDSVSGDSVLDCSSAIKLLSSALEADSTSGGLEELPEPIAGLHFLDDFLLAWSLSPAGPVAVRARVHMHLGSFEHCPWPMVVSRSSSLIFESVDLNYSGKVLLLP
jgi:hypothetical protein